MNNNNNSKKKKTEKDRKFIRQNSSEARGITNNLSIQRRRETFQFLRDNLHFHRILIVVATIHLNIAKYRHFKKCMNFC